MIYGVSSLILFFFSILHFTVLIANPALLKMLNVPPDPIIGAVILISSILFFLGANSTLKGKEEKRAYVLVGWFIGALVTFVSSLVLVSNAFRSILLGSENVADWSISDDLVPGLYLGVLVILLLPVVILHGKHEMHGNKREGGNAE
jgi:hypothetical protein